MEFWKRITIGFMILGQKKRLFSDGKSRGAILAGAAFKRFIRI